MPSFFFQSKELTAHHHRGLQATLAVPSKDLTVLMEEAEASLTGLFPIRQASILNSSAYHPHR